MAVEAAAKGAAHSAESVSTDTAPSPAKPKASKKEANILARAFVRKLAERHKRTPTAREIAEAVGCSLGLVSSLPVWQAIQEQKVKDRESKKGKTVSLTTRLQKAAGLEDDSLAKLIAEQREDEEPSPLVDDEPEDRDGSPRKAKVYRKR